jgi:hypothetical protein
MRKKALLLSMALTVFGAQFQRAYADCYDVFGCTDRNMFRLRDMLDGPNCQFLFEMRNRIYAQHGYCFTTPKAISLLGNEGCRVRSVDALGLNRFERANAVTIRLAEQSKGCGE